MRTALGILMIMAFAPIAKAQDGCGATTACAGQAVAGTNASSDPGIPGFCPNTTNAIWYSFTTNSQGGPVDVEVTGIDCADVPGMGDELVAVILSAPSCNGPFTSVSSCSSGANAIMITTTALAPNTEYYVLVAGEIDTSGAALCDHSITVSGEGADVLGVDILVSADTVIGVEEDVQLYVIGSSGSVEWSPSTGLSNTSIADPIASPLSTTTYTVSIDMGECTYIDQVLVEVIDRIVPPNTFTPNGDGKNDVWEIPGIEDYPGAEILIFDRWGQRVYTSTGYREPWDGTNGGSRLPDATYYYHIQLNQLEGRSPPYTGFISIIR